MVKLVGSLCHVQLGLNVCPCTHVPDPPLRPVSPTVGQRFLAEALHGLGKHAGPEGHVVDAAGGRSWRQRCGARRWRGHCEQARDVMHGGGQAGGWHELALYRVVVETARVECGVIAGHPVLDEVDCRRVEHEHWGPQRVGKGAGILAGHLARPALRRQWGGKEAFCRTGRSTEFGTMGRTSSAEGIPRSREGARRRRCHWPRARLLCVSCMRATN